MVGDGIVAGPGTLFKLADRIEVKFGEITFRPSPLRGQAALPFNWRLTVLWNAAADKRWYAGKVVKSEALHVTVEFDGEWVISDTAHGHW